MHVILWHRLDNASCDSALKEKKTRRLHWTEFVGMTLEMRESVLDFRNEPLSWQQDDIQLCHLNFGAEMNPMTKNITFHHLLQLWRPLMSIFIWRASNGCEAISCFFNTFLTIGFLRARDYQGEKTLRSNITKGIIIVFVGLISFLRVAVIVWFVFWNSCKTDAHKSGDCIR